jgi:TolB-like protein
MVLRDNPRKPQFIETLPKRGYRFATEVTFEPAEEAAEANSTAMEAVEDVEPAPATDNAAGALVAVDRPAARPSFGVRAGGFLRWTSWSALVIVALAAAVMVWFPHRITERPAVLSLGIVPFASEGNGAEALGESFRLDLTDTLSQLPNVQVRASHSMTKLKPDDASLQAASRSLHLDVFLLGKLVLHDQQCSLSFELVRGRDAAHLASFHYSGSVNELASIRDKVQRSIFSALQLTDNSIQASNGSTADPQAYSAYLQARDWARQRTPSALDSAISQYQLAIGRDAGFARAYAGMATAHLCLASSGVSSLGNYHQARLFAQKALQLNPSLAEAHAVLGFVASRVDWDAAKGESELRQAVQLEPDQAAYHGWLAEFLAQEGRFDEGFQQSELAREADPLWPHVYTYEQFVAAAARNFPRQIQAAKQYAVLLPDLPIAHGRLAWALFAGGHYEEALGEWRFMAAKEKDQERMALEERGLTAFRRGGVSAYAAVRLSAITDHLDTAASHPEDFQPEEWYAFTGNHGQAIALLDKKVEQHDPAAFDMTVNPMFDSLHHDARFLALLKKVGLKLSLAAPQSLRASLR